MRRRDAGDVVPDVAVLRLQRVALHADIGRENRRQQALLIGKVRGIAAGIAARAIDRFDGARR